MINRKHNKPYKYKLISKKVEYNTTSGLYCTTHDTKVPLSRPEFFRSKIITNGFHVDNKEGDSGFGYGIIICRELRVQLGLMDNSDVN